MSSYLERVKQLAERLVATGLASASQMLPCTDIEIGDIERAQGAPLPAAYRAFLKLMGRGAGELFEGSDCFYPEVLDAKLFAKALLVEDGGGHKLPQDAIVILVHQGYQFYYCEASQGENPPVLHYLEGSGVRQSDTSFMKFLETSGADYERPNEELLEDDDV